MEPRPAQRSLRREKVSWPREMLDGLDSLPASPPPLGLVGLRSIVDFQPIGIHQMPGQGTSAPTNEKFQLVSGSCSYSRGFYHPTSAILKMGHDQSHIIHVNLILAAVDFTTPGYNRAHFGKDLRNS